ncbi:hypothetical protein TNIN_438871 [Trichonephila inaurata madagascariensis]|uniref:Uncharacterized protein n=1 Tax=Trichonephila inaurata madagascariensis TaxID=2747483 RepID=A0A8X7CEY7_9ARAC|nr:hypothetical protein TNIN_438871 [Trichonephila inaurata madagascariensis]
MYRTRLESIQVDRSIWRRVFASRIGFCHLDGSVTTPLRDPASRSQQTVCIGTNTRLLRLNLSACEVTYFSLHFCCICRQKKNSSIPILIIRMKKFMQNSSLTHVL